MKMKIELVCGCYKSVLWLQKLAGTVIDDVLVYSSVLYILILTMFRITVCLYVCIYIGVLISTYTVLG